MGPACRPPAPVSNVRSARPPRTQTVRGSCRHLPKLCRFVIGVRCSPHFGLDPWDLEEPELDCGLLLSPPQATGQCSVLSSLCSFSNGPWLYKRRESGAWAVGAALLRGISPPGLRAVLAGARGEDQRESLQNWQGLVAPRRPRWTSRGHGRAGAVCLVQLWASGREAGQHRAPEKPWSVGRGCRDSAARNLLAFW